MYKRIVKLEAYNEVDGVLEAEPFFNTTQLRIVFDIDVGFEQALAQSRLTIYNLSEANSLALLRGHYEDTEKDEETSQRVLINFSVGYADENEGVLELLLSGYVMNGAATRVLPNYITELYVLPKSAGFFHADFEPHSTMKAGQKPEQSESLKVAIETICKGAGFIDAGSVEFFLPEAVLNKPMGNKVLRPHPDTGIFGELERLAKIYKFSYIATSNGVAFYPILGNSKKDLDAYNHVISEHDDELTKILPQKLRGSPIAGIMTMEIPYALAPHIRPGFVVDTTNIQGAENLEKADDGGDKGDGAARGQGLTFYTNIGNTLYYDNGVSRYAIMKDYMVMRVKHVGDNFSQQWLSTIFCSVPTGGKNGDDE